MNMTLADILGPGAVLSDLRAQNKKQVLHDLAVGLSEQTGVEARAILDVLAQREKLGSTGLGQGIAIPHGRLPSLARVHGMFARLASPVSFDSVDGEPIDIVFGLISPEHAGADHLTALARVSRLLRDQRTLAKLRGTKSKEGLYAIITEPAASTATAA
jgi:PTS system nitrogen regulatory IIA component